VRFDTDRKERPPHLLMLRVLLVCALATTQLDAQVAAATLSGGITTTDARVSSARISIKNPG
jgi:hypothetical protein